MAAWFRIPLEESSAGGLTQQLFYVFAPVPHCSYSCPRAGLRARTGRPQACAFQVAPIVGCRICSYQKNPRRITKCNSATLCVWACIFQTFRGSRSIVGMSSFHHNGTAGLPSRFKSHTTENNMHPHAILVCSVICFI